MYVFIFIHSYHVFSCAYNYRNIFISIDMFATKLWNRLFDDIRPLKELILGA